MKNINKFRTILNFNIFKEKLPNELPNKILNFIIGINKLFSDICYSCYI